ncbi:MAG: response regulator [Desulfuromonadales bacterium]|jgi:CheY-like chemotaxis protein|nr:response regulator [Desulfuromonadales bacterium]
MHKILVVDDDRDMRDNIVEILTDSEFEIAAAEDGEDALRQLKGQSFDLVLLDLLMPGLSGMDVLSMIKRESPSTQVIMVTAFSTVDNAVEAMRKGADDYITKPFKINELRMTVRKCLEQARFKSCKMLLDMDDTFSSLANSIRREILLLIDREGKIRFMDICRRLEIEDHTKVNFHLKVLKEASLVQQDERKYYALSGGGRTVIDCLNTVVKGLTS